MKRLLFAMLALVAFTLSFSSCATIVGGAKYNARVRVPDHPNARISINGMYRGNGEASTLVDRKACDMINITVQEGDDEPQTSVFSGKKFRTGTLIADILAFFPGGIIVDAITGAWWRPDEREMGVSRIDTDNYLYTITYRPNEKKPSIKNTCFYTNTPNTRCNHCVGTKHHSPGYYANQTVDTDKNRSSTGAETTFGRRRIDPRGIRQGKSKTARVRLGHRCRGQKRKEDDFKLSSFCFVGFVGALLAF